MTQLTEKEHKCQMADMKAFDEQMPCIGIFWYDLESHSLFGVHKKEITPKMVEEAAEKGLPFINYPHLHRQVWAKEYFKAQAKHEENKFHEVVWLGTSTSSLSLSDIGQSLYSTNSQPSLRKNSLFLTSSLSMMNIGISVMVGRVICSLNSSYSKKRVCQNTIMKQRIPRI